MYNTHMNTRIGFCCKWLNDPTECGGMKVNALDRDLNGRSTTMRLLREHADGVIVGSAIVKHIETTDKAGLDAVKNAIANLSASLVGALNP